MYDLDVCTQYRAIFQRKLVLPVNVYIWCGCVYSIPSYISWRKLVLPVNVYVWCDVCTQYRAIFHEQLHQTLCIGQWVMQQVLGLGGMTNTLPCLREDREIVDKSSFPGLLTLFLSSDMQSKLVTHSRPSRFSISGGPLCPEVISVVKKLSQC